MKAKDAGFRSPAFGGWAVAAISLLSLLMLAACGGGGGGAAAPAEEAAGETAAPYWSKS